MIKNVSSTMKNLSEFLAPVSDETTVCELDGKIQAMGYNYVNVETFTTAVSNHPKIHVKPNMLNSTYLGEEGRDLFLPVQEPLLKRFVRTTYELGFTAGLQVVSEEGHGIVRKAAFLLLSTIRVYDNVTSRLTLSTCEDSLTQIESCSLTRSWSHSTVRCIAWHHYCTKIAVASLDDCVRIYSQNSPAVPQLKCQQQKRITCLAWRPLSNSEIAVGCEYGIFIWDVDPSSAATRLSVKNAILLKRINHWPVLTLAWDWKGDILASGAGCDSAILIWNVEFDRTNSLKRAGSRGNSLVKWSSNGSRMFSASTGVVFRLWECYNWKSEYWSILSGRIQTACWSPCGTIVLFATTDTPMIYAIMFGCGDDIFVSKSKNSTSKAIPMFDLTKTELGGFVVGGVVQNMAWDPKGHNLAVLFKETDYIALFKVTLHPVLQLNPTGFVVGFEGEVPVAIDFQKNCPDWACLSVAWSTGRVQHFPIVYFETVMPEIRSGADAQSSFQASFRN